MTRRPSSLWLLPATLLVHRGVLLARYGGDLDSLFRGNPHWVTVQLQAVAALEAQPVASLWTLQQSPPVPNAILAALLQVLSWPAGVGWGLVAVHLLCTLGVALLLALVGRRILPAGLATTLGLFWILNPDVVVLETMGMGQIFYENLAALGLMLCVYAYLRWCEAAQPQRWAMVLGVCLGLLALTRSSYGFFSFAVLALMLGLLLTRSLWVDAAGHRAAWRQVAVCAVLALSIQGAWSLKNLAVYGHWTWPASTWGGASLAASLDGIGEGDRLATSILLEAPSYESWFVHYVNLHGARPWSADWKGSTFCPESAKERDRDVTARLRGQNRPENSECLRLVSEAFGDASIRFLLRHPGVLLKKIKLGYATYWFPIRYHGDQYLSLFSTDWRVERSLRPWRSAGQLLSGELPEPAYVHSGSPPDTTRRPARLWTLDRPVIVWWLVELIVLHLLVPFVVGAILWQVYRNREIMPRDALVLMLALTYAYSAGLHNLAEFGENMRFRWNVEPVIWLLTADGLARLWRFAAGRASQRKTSR